MFILALGTVGGALLGTPSMADEEIQIELNATPGDFYKQAVELNKIGLTEQARHILNAAIKLDPKAPESDDARRYLSLYMPRYPVPIEAQVINNTGVKLERSKKSEEAVQIFQKCTDEHPFFELPYTNLSEVFFSKKDYSKSAKYAKDALAINANFVPAWLRLGKALEGAGDSGGAKQAFTRATQLDPNNSEAKEALKGKGK